MSHKSVSSPKPCVLQCKNALCPIRVSSVTSLVFASVRMCSRVSASPEPCVLSVRMPCVSECLLVISCDQQCKAILCSRVSDSHGTYLFHCKNTNTHLCEYNRKTELTNFWVGHNSYLYKTSMFRMVSPVVLSPVTTSASPNPAKATSQSNQVNIIYFSDL